MTNSNEYRPNLISYQFVAKYNWKNIRHAAVLFNPMLDGHGGMDHLTMKRGYPQEYRRPPEEWLDLFRSLPDYNAGHVIAESIRNTFQNLRCIVWTRETGLCQQKDEHAEKSQRPYYCLVFFSGSEVKVQPMKVWFTVKNGKPEPVTEAGEPLPANAHSLISGPAVWWGGPVSAAQVATGLSDFPHMLELRTSKARGAVGEDIAVAQRLTEVALTHHLDLEDRAGEALAIRCPVAQAGKELPAPRARLGARWARQRHSARPTGRRGCSRRPCRGHTYVSC